MARQGREHCVTEELAKQMRVRRARGETCAQIGRAMGFSKSTVSNHTGCGCMHKRGKDEPLQPARQQKSDARYWIEIHHVRSRPDLRVFALLDHRPVYTDMMRLCHAHGIDAVDFADDKGTRPQDRVYHGSVYLAKTQMYALARFTIRRLRGAVYLEDFFR
jgi:hypothetical protein